jgi:DnaJ-class molecular chaperone
MQILGVTPISTWEEVRAAHRKLSAQYHPDRQRTARQRAAAEKKFVQVQKAFEVLKTRYPEAA